LDDTRRNDESVPLEEENTAKGRSR